jgi:hypothetical protein
MIKIEHPDLDKIAKDYFDDVKVEIMKRCGYLLRVFDVLYNGFAFSTLKDYRLNEHTKRSLTNQLLVSNKLANKTQYANVIVDNLFNWVTVNRNSLDRIATHLNNDIHLEKIILCRPDKAAQTENDLFESIGLANPLTNELKGFVNSIIDYSLFQRYAYDISIKLKVNTCPYCNRNYINTVIDKKGNQIIRPTFDHFFPQKHYPFLALCFYNLIPSCYYCNSSLKGDKRVSIDTHIHPYKEGFDKDATFHVLISNLKPNKSDPENYTLLFAENQFISDTRYRKIFGGVRGAVNPDEGNINLFRLKDIYQSHLDIVGELVVKCDKLSSSYANSLQPLFKSLGSSREEFYQFYFGNYFNENDFHRRPMAKLSKDVVSQIIPNFEK